MSPLCESFLREEQLNQMEPFYPLHVRVCDACFLVQLDTYVPPAEIFSEYAYFSSYSSSWVRHAREYTDSISERLGLTASDLVVEVASNDGYLLQHFVERGIPVLGIDPAENVAKAAAERGVPTLVEFFGLESARRLVAEGKMARLIVGNNVLAQVPDLNDFVGGIRTLLAPNGTATLEFPHLMRLMAGVQYDTIYHEHYSYFSLATVASIAQAHGLSLYDVEELGTHGGSLRVYLEHEGVARPRSNAVAELLNREAAAGLRSPVAYRRFADQVIDSKHSLLELLIQLKRAGKSIIGYGAPGKGNTLLNYCGIRGDFLDYTVDRNPYKHGLYLPGTHIRIYPPERIAETRPDAIVVLPWNLVNEIKAELAYARDWGARLIVPIPRARFVDEPPASIEAASA
jgi:SAM-dependent methyltransferase